MIYRIVISLILLFYLPFYAQSAENYRFNKISMKDGMSSNIVTAIIQDTQGFIWIGTFNGLMRYDGQNFNHYLNELDPYNKAGSKSIRALCEDKSGNIWIGTRDSGLYKIDSGSNGKIQSQIPKKCPGIDNSLIFTIFEDKAGALWIGTYNSGLKKFDKNLKTFKQYNLEQKGADGVLYNSITSIFEDNSGTLWIGTFLSGLYWFDREKETFIDYNNESTDAKDLTNYAIISFTEDHSGMIWIGTEGDGIFKFDKKKNTFENYRNNDENTGLSSNYVMSVYKDSTQTIWVGTESGINKYDKTTNRFHLQKRYSSNSRNIDSKIHSIIEDNSGLLWFGTNDGINILNKQKNMIKIFKNAPLDRDSLSITSVWAFGEDNSGNIWMGGSKGLNKFNPTSKKFSRFDLTNNQINTLVVDHKGFIWFGQDYGILNKFNPADKVLTKYSNKENDVFNSAIIIFLYEDSLKNLWVATINGLFKLNKQRKLVKCYKYDPDLKNGLKSNIFYSIIESEPGIFWLGTEKGLVKFNHNEDVFKTYLHQEGVINALSDNRVGNLTIDKKGNIWIGTIGGGLNKFNIQNESFITFTVKDGLPSNFIYGILIDKNKNLWVSTAKGLSFFNPDQKKFYNFDIIDGIQGYKYTNNSCLRSRSGNLYFGGTKGINVINPDKFHLSTKTPPIKITSLELIDGNRKYLKPVIENQIIDLYPRDYYISFNFTALDYSNPKKNKFAYKLEGLKNNWIYTSGQKPFATYSSLAPGKYIFKVKGSNSDGIWNPKIASVNIIVHPPFWRTWWFKIILFFFCMGIIIKIYQRRIKQLELKFQLNAKKEDIFSRYKISPREGEIINLLIEKKSNKEIENILFISPHTVKNHIHHIFRKLKLKSRGELYSFFKNSSHK